MSMDRMVISSLLPLREPTRQTMKPCFDRVDNLAKALMAAFVAIVLAAFGRYKDIVKEPLNSLTFTIALFLILTLIFGYVLWLYVNYMYNQVNLTKWQFMCHVALVSFSVICLECTNVMLLAFVNPVNALFACFLVVVPFVIGMLGYAGSRINGTNHLPRDQNFESTMKSCSDVVYLTTGGDFLMHLAVVFEYYKNPSLRVNQLPSVDISVTFFASIMGVFLMMVIAMPLQLLPHTVRSKLLFIFKFMKYFMLFLTATAAMTLGGKFLDGLVLLVLMPVLVVIVTYRAVLLFTGAGVDPDSNYNNEEPEIPSMMTGVTNACIVLLSSVYALYTGGEHGDDVYFRVGIFVLVCTIASCLSWIALLMNPSTNEQRDNVTKLVIGILLGLMITIAAVFLLKICVDLSDQTK